jgi:hypothetical protein
MSIGHKLTGSRLFPEEDGELSVPLISVSIRASPRQMRALADNLRRAADAFESGQIKMTCYPLGTSKSHPDYPAEIYVHINDE